MPLFGRPDGTLIKNESQVRRMIPYLMLGRNESAIYHEQHYDLTKTKPWLHEWNRTHDQAVTLFHLFLWASGQVAHKRDGMNRFVSGGQLWQRKGVWLSFAAKKKFRDESPLVTVKLEFPAEETFEAMVHRVVSSIDEGRTVERTVDKEVKLAMALPHWVRRFVMWSLRNLDKVNLMPGAMIVNDPLYATCFIANLGSVGVDHTYHHLYETGTCSVFAVMGKPEKKLYVDDKGQPAVREGMEVRWTFDERINDGFYCAATLKAVQRIVEDPERYIGTATGPGKRPRATKGADAVAVEEQKVAVTVEGARNGANGHAAPAKGSAGEQSA